MRVTNQGYGRTLLAKNALWIAWGQVLRVVGQAIYFVLIARSLGSSEFGAYAGALAMVAVLAPFSSLGSGNILIKNVARNPAMFLNFGAARWRRPWEVGLILLAIVAAVASWWLPATTPRGLIVAIGAADLLFVRRSRLAPRPIRRTRRWPERHCSRC